MKKALKKLTQSKRFWFSLIVFGALLGAFILIALLSVVEPIALGTGLVMLGAPLYGYLIGETTRPSGTVGGKKLEKTEK